MCYDVGYITFTLCVYNLSLKSGGGGDGEEVTGKMTAKPVIVAVLSFPQAQFVVDLTGIISTTGGIHRVKK